MKGTFADVLIFHHPELDAREAAAHGLEAGSNESAQEELVQSLYAVHLQFFCLYARHANPRVAEGATGEGDSPEYSQRNSKE